MKPPDHTIEAMDPGRFVVKVGRHVAGHLAEDGEHPGLWIVTDQDGRFMAGISTGKQARSSWRLGSWRKTNRPKTTKPARADPAG